MSNSSLQRYLTVLLVVAALSMVSMFIGFSCSRKEAEPVEPPPVTIALQLVPGAPDGPSLIVARLFSIRMRQQKLDSLSKEGTEISPITISFGRNTWKNGIKFFIVNGDTVSSLESFAQSRVELLMCPSSRQLKFEERSIYQAFYSFSPTSCVSVPQKLYAEFTINGYTMRSNQVEIQAPPLTEYELLVRKAQVQQITDRKGLLDTAGEIIAAYPDRVAGYWYKGLALEKKGDYGQALKAYRSALKNIPAPGKKKLSQPPRLILSGIRRLLKIVGNNSPGDKK